MSLHSLKLFFQGSCWAFAATAVMEYWSNCNKTNQLYSEQNLVDCDTNSAGCDGGHPLYAFVYSYSGMSDGRKYLYAAKEQQCQRKKYPPIYKFDMACGDSTDGDEKRLMSILATYGPVTTAIGLCSKETPISFYKNNDFSFRFNRRWKIRILQVRSVQVEEMFEQRSRPCCRKTIERKHFCNLKRCRFQTIVGYGTDKTQGDYWIVRNSWGTTWGEKGLDSLHIVEALITYNFFHRLLQNRERLQYVRHCQWGFWALLRKVCRKIKSI